MIPYEFLVFGFGSGAPRPPAVAKADAKLLVVVVGNPIPTGGIPGYKNDVLLLEVGVGEIVDAAPTRCLRTPDLTCGGG